MSDLCATYFFSCMNDRQRKYNSLSRTYCTQRKNKLLLLLLLLLLL